MPTDLMMRLPPTMVPSEMAAEQIIMSHSGKPELSGADMPNDSAMPSMPIDMNFWPSCAPCRKDSATAHRSWMMTNALLAAWRFAALNTRSMMRVKTHPSKKPATSENTMP